MLWRVIFESLVFVGFEWNRLPLGGINSDHISKTHSYSWICGFHQTETSYLRHVCAVKGVWWIWIGSLIRANLRGWGWSVGSWRPFTLSLFPFSCTHFCNASRAITQQSDHPAPLHQVKPGHTLLLLHPLSISTHNLQFPSTNQHIWRHRDVTSRLLISLLSVSLSVLSLAFPSLICLTLLPSLASFIHPLRHDSLC